MSGGSNCSSMTSGVGTPSDIRGSLSHYLNGRNIVMDTDSIHEDSSIEDALEEGEDNRNGLDEIDMEDMGELCPGGSMECDQVNIKCANLEHFSSIIDC